ncbi:hypothetical protein [Streptomyces sp. NBC_01445]|uniref:hypothetical protein n=1 Tax=Streptomyces sp. NBC_01445 TaxID=2903869 RepID=UPI002DD80F45|nr:hypothetical protein [Streptomyces sp. NBC_01445]WSE10090.1 hypothetical protein OG574_46265 [Streptomyces sp. NBC_01445]
MPIHPGTVEDRAAGTRDLYEQAEQRLLGIVARQLADGLDAPGWVERTCPPYNPHGAPHRPFSTSSARP